MERQSRPNRPNRRKDVSMAAKPLPSPELLRQLLRYDPQTGKLFWLERHLSIYDFSDTSAPRRCRVFNALFAGREAGQLGSGGYIIVTINHIPFRAHRLIWAMNNDEQFPSNLQIDHINGDRTDNRISNLRLATNRENARNQRRRMTNKSGHNGVYWDSATNKWRAQITLNGKTYALGRFSTKSKAAHARRSAHLNSFFYHSHGSDKDAN